jgi:thymidylate synthase
VFLGLPYNIASYAALVHLVAHVTGYEVGTFGVTLGDAHIYLNHMEQVKLLLSREPFPQPALQIEYEVDDPYTNLFGIQHGHVKLLNYKAHPRIPAPIAV